MSKQAAHRTTTKGNVKGGEGRVKRRRAEGVARERERGRRWQQVSEREPEMWEVNKNLHRVGHTSDQRVCVCVDAVAMATANAAQGARSP